MKIPSWLLVISAAAIVLGTQAYFSRHYVPSLLESPLPGGWDGTAHYGVATLYAKSLYPALSGWLPDYYAGMPFPNFYPPNLYILIASLQRLGLDPLTSYWTVELTASAAVPLLIMACAKRITGSLAAATLAGILGVCYMVDAHYQSGFGVAYQGTFDIGLASHVIGFCALLASLYFLLDIERRGAVVFASISLAAIPLSNVHVTWNALLFFGPLVVFRVLQAEPTRRRRRMARYALSAGCGLLLASVWLVPMLANLGELPTIAQPRRATAGLGITLYFPVSAFALAGIVAYRNRNAPMLALTTGATLTLLFFYLPTSELLGDLPIQPWRVMPAIYFLSPLAACYLVTAADTERLRLVLRSAVAIGCIAFVSFVEPMGWHGGRVTAEQMRQYEVCLRALEHPGTGRTLAEVGTGRGDVYALQVLLGIHGFRSLTTVFREATPSAYFAVPLRNRYSESPHSFGLDRKIRPGDLLTDAAIRYDRARLELFGVRYVIVQSQRAKEIARSTEGARFVSSSGAWDIYEFADHGDLAVVPKYEPVLAFSDYRVKRRPDYGFDFVRLSEELFMDGRLDVPLVRSTTGKIDSEPHLDRFKRILIADYRYHDEDKAFDRLSAFSERGKLYLFESSSRLYSRLRSLAAERNSIYLLPRAGMGSGQDATNEIKAAIDVVVETAEPLTDVPAITSVNDEGLRFSIELERKPNKHVPIWIRQTYFPSWKTNRGDDIYMATPVFQLVFASERTTTLVFARQASEIFGRACSLLGLIILVFVSWRSRRRRLGGLPA